MFRIVLAGHGRVRSPQPSSLFIRMVVTNHADKRHFEGLKRPNYHLIFINSPVKHNSLKRHLNHRLIIFS